MFSIYVVLADIPMTYNLFNLVFVIVLLSLAGQGTLLPTVAEKLKMIDKNTNVLRTFNDYQEENEVSFIKIKVTEDHPFAGKTFERSRLAAGIPCGACVPGRYVPLRQTETPGYTAGM